MTEEQIEQVIEAVLKKQKNFICPIGIDEAQHAIDHNFIRSLITISEKVDKIKWGMLGSVIKTITLSLLAATVVGLVILAKEKGIGL